MPFSKQRSRREFLIAGSSSALAAAAATAMGQTNLLAPDAPPDQSNPHSLADVFEHGPQRTFTGDKATQAAMPLGGIGAGCVFLHGYGGLQDFSIRCRAETVALPAGFTSNSSEAAFAVLHVKGASGVTKLVEGPFPFSKSSIRVSRGRERAAVASRGFRALENPC